MRTGNLRKVEAMFLSLTLVLSFFSVSSVIAPRVQAATTISLVPTSNGFYTSWSGNLSDVDETSGFDCSNDDVIKSTGSNSRESFVLDLSSIPDGATITSVDITVRDRGEDNPGGTYKTFARLNTTNTDATALLAATGGSGDPCSSPKTQTIDVPDTVKSGATALEIGVVKINSTGSANRTVRVGTITAVVTYTPVPPPDTTPPVVTITPDSQTVEATSPTGATAAFTVTAIDNIDGNISGSAVCIPTSGSTFPLGMTTVTCSATDAAGNTGSDTATVAVVDTTPPVITLNGPATMGLNVGDPYSEPGATATDAVDPVVSVIIGGAAVNTAVPGIYVVTYNATDASGNNALQVTRTVTVSDVNAPVINVVSDVTVEATDASGATVTYADVTATDDVDGTIPATCTPISGSVFPLGTTAVACTATDTAGNVGNGVAFSVIVEDTTPPVITLNGSMTMALTVGDAYTEDGATATDTVDMSVPVIVGGDTVDTATSGIYIVTYNATDDSGNNALEVTRTVTVSPAPVASIFGMKFNDLNGNGVKDQGESGVSGWNIILSHGISTTTVLTDQLGDYSFSPLGAGVYTVSEEHRAGWFQTFPGGAGLWGVTLAPGEQAGDKDFGNYQHLVISSETAVDPAETSAVVAWTTDRPGTSRVIYDTVSYLTLGTVPNYGYAFSTATFDTDPKVTAHSVTLTELTAGTPYFYRVISSASPEAVGGEQTFSTASPAPAPAPTGGGGGGGGGGGYFPPPAPYVPETDYTSLLNQFNTLVAANQPTQETGGVGILPLEGSEGIVAGALITKEETVAENPPENIQVSPEGVVLGEGTPEQTASFIDFVKNNWWWLLILLLIILVIWWLSRRKEKDKLK